MRSTIYETNEENNDVVDAIGQIHINPLVQFQLWLIPNLRFRLCLLSYMNMIEYNLFSVFLSVSSFDFFCVCMICGF